MVLIFYLFLGFCGLFLFVLFLSIVLISNSLEEEEILINAEHEEEEELGDDVENNEKGVKVFRQSAFRGSGLVDKTRSYIFALSELFFKIVRMPIFIFCYCMHCTLEINNDFITIE